MFVPIVPFVPHTTVINKTIVYSDTVLPLNDTGNNLKVTSISDVSELFLESCLKTIFESNPNVIFYTIQYSKNDKKVYFYTNQDITTKAYEESKFKNYKPITSRTEILEEVKNVLLAQNIKDNDCISLYDVLMLLKKLNNEYDSVIRRYENRFDYIVKGRLGNSSSVRYHDFDYQKNILHISFSRYRSCSYGDIYFAKQNGDLYVAKSESYWTNEVFSVLSSTLSEMYDELLKYADYNDYHQFVKDDKKSVNSNFNVKISNHGVRILVKDFNNRCMNELELFAPSYKSGYKLKCNSNIVNEAISGKETEIFKRIFVKISDCPEWSQTMLYEIRQNQLAEEQKIEDEKKCKEMRKQKRLELTRKIFPFLKKEKSARTQF